MADVVVGNLAAAVESKTLLLAETAGQTVTGDLIPSGSAQVGWVLRTVTVLSDAQVKALPTTAVTIVAAPGSGFRVRPLAVSLISNFTAGAYTGFNATYVDIHILSGLNYVGYGPVNDSTTTPALTTITDFLGSPTARMYDQVIPNPAAFGASQGYVMNINVGDRTEQNNAPLMIGIDNNGTGNLTGGNAANALTVVTYYVKESI